MSSKKRFLMVPNGDEKRVYQLEEFKGTVSPDKLPECPCCKTRLTPGFDICQFGMFEDKYKSYLLCWPCGKAFELDYAIPTYELFSKREQTQLFTSKKSHEVGSDRRER